MIREINDEHGRQTDQILLARSDRSGTEGAINDPAAGTGKAGLARRLALGSDIEKSPVKQKVVGSIASLCRNLRIQFIAEGIETASEPRGVTQSRGGGAG
jgi:hypothetical protein